MKIVEVTKTNEDNYAKKIAKLEEKVWNIMENNGQKGQFFTTGEHDIRDYAESNENTVMAMVNDKDDVVSAAYITQGQKLFTYNDITKYFKNSPEYKEWIKSQYPNEAEYENAALNGYSIKMTAYENARKRILEENPNYSSIIEIMNQEKAENDGVLDEKSVLRETLAKYMNEYVENLNSKEALKAYEDFYGLTYSDLKDIIQNNKEKNVVANRLSQDVETEKEQEEFSKNAPFIVYSRENDKHPERYFTANPTNSVEIDTYITDPEIRSEGAARILAYEGVKKHINRFLANPENKEIFLCSTLHQENVSSKYVSEFFGLTDSVLVNRRKGRDREVHIVGIKREDAQQYLKDMAEKLAVLYNYNPQRLEISDERRLDILKEQKQYEEKELNRLEEIVERPEEQKKIRGYSKTTSKRFKGFISQKRKKIQKLTEKESKEHEIE